MRRDVRLHKNHRLKDKKVSDMMSPGVQLQMLSQKTNRHPTPVRDPDRPLRLRDGTVVARDVQTALEFVRDASGPSLWALSGSILQVSTPDSETRFAVLYDISGRPSYRPCKTLEDVAALARELRLLGADLDVTQGA